MKLQGKNVVVTGGGNGIGRALCERFAGEQACGIVVADINFADAQKTADDLGDIAKPFECDISVESQVQKLVEFSERQLGQIDLFCSNAGIALGEGLESSNEHWRRIIDVNLMSHIYAARAVIPHMVKRGSGYLLHTASAAGLLTEMSSAPYSVTKHGVVSLAEWLAIEYAAKGIKVSCLCPQGVQTPMLDGIDGPFAEMLKENSISPEAVADAVVAALAAERFLVLPHPEVSEYFQRKATDYDRWLRGMQRLKQSMHSP